MVVYEDVVLIVDMEVFVCIEIGVWYGDEGYMGVCEGFGGFVVYCIVISDLVFYIYSCNWIYIYVLI